MFSHVMLGVNDLEVLKKFYEALHGTLGIAPGAANESRYSYRSTIGFAAQSTEQYDAFHPAGIANGGTSCEDAPGFRVSLMGRIYLGYLRDPDGKKPCVLHLPAQ